MTALLLLGRIIFGGYFMYSGFMHLKDEKSMTGYAKMKGVPSPRAAVLASGILLLLGGAGVVFNMQYREALILLVVFLVPTTFMMHAFWRTQDANARMADRIQFLKNLGLIGAVLMLLGM